MDIEKSFLEVVFQQISYDDILLQHYPFSDKIVTKEMFLHSAESYNKHRSTEELEASYQYMMANTSLFPNLEHLSLIIKAAQQMLTFNGHEIQCEYLELLRWREISLSLGDDIFTTAYLAYYDYIHNIASKEFSWPAIISTNNTRLQSILAEGIAENHFHLTGSTQIFPVSWISLMNHVTGRAKDFNEFERLLHPKAITSNKSKRLLSLKDQCLIAADIRVSLFKKFSGYYVDLYNQYLTYQLIVQTDFFPTVWELQSDINSLKKAKGAKTTHGNLDYALTKQILPYNNNNSRLLAGERYFLYQCFSHLLSGKFGSLELRLFYVYLLIKNTFRQELIQTNNEIGFSNFKAYQDRKSDFVKGDKYYQYHYEQVRLALNATMEEQNIVSLEARISPRSKGFQIQSYIQDYQKAFLQKEQDFHPDTLLGSTDNSYPPQKLFYVLHFPKSGTKTFTEKASEYIYCRNHDLRRRVHSQGQGIAELLKSQCEESHLVKGIDTCSSEIGYRPEIFAETFRMLRNIHIPAVPFALYTERSPQYLRATNHSGEDFMGLLDGLRSIDETITFCEFKRGDRLGHALALGLDPYDYADKKGNTIITTKQDALDDISWALYKSSLLGVPIQPPLRSQLTLEAQRLLSEIYETTISLSDYQQAWLLRGDNPYAYPLERKDVEVSHSLVSTEQSLESPQYQLGTAGDNARTVQQYVEIYREYHFHGKVKEKGAVQYVKKISESQCYFISQLQQAMQQEIMELGIGIETNPSSNYLISTFKRYDQHPIFKFNSIGLKECKYPLSVSINTDDQGVFDTSLENEYALLAIALEKKCDAEGNRLHTPEDIYKWLDYVRRMGIQQSFKKPKSL